MKFKTTVQKKDGVRLVAEMPKAIRHNLKPGDELECEKIEKNG